MRDGRLILESDTGSVSLPLLNASELITWLNLALRNALDTDIKINGMGIFDTPEESSENETGK
jgi:hypothetical protein